ncbi:Glycine oxidase [subsurface metagenome]
MSKEEVVIVGAGVIGCSIAYHLARQGVPSQVIESDSIAARASGKAWAVIPYPPIYLESRPSDNRLISVPVGSVSQWLELRWIGYHRFPDIALDLQEKGGIDIEYGELPAIRLALSESDEKIAKEGLSFLKSQGYHEGHWIKGDDLRAIFPDINPLVRGGRVRPFLQVEPYKYTLGLAQAAEKMGANFRQGEVVGFRHEGSKLTAVILATGTEVKADVFVLATGPWTGQVTSKLGKEMPTLVIRAQCVRVQAPKPFPPYLLSTPYPTNLAIVPKVDGSVILGFSSALDDPQTSFDAPLTTEEGKTMLINGAIDLLPTLNEAELIEQRGDFECWSPPPNCTQPVIGRLPEWDNAYIATRFGTIGITMSPGAGQVMADLIIGGDRPPHRFKAMIDYLSPARLQ